MCRRYSGRTLVVLSLVQPRVVQVQQETREPRGRSSEKALGAPASRFQAPAPGSLLSFLPSPWVQVLYLFYHLAFSISTK